MNCIPDVRVRTSSARLALLCLTLGAASIAVAQDRVVADPPFRALLDGNSRFATDSTAVPHGARRLELQSGQHPHTVVVTCSDSRVAPEILFDQGLGELFVIRTAGHVIDEVALGSIEYGIEHLGASLLVVIGHEQCGAVKAAIGANAARANPSAATSEHQGAVDSVGAVVAPIAVALEGHPGSADDREHVAACVELNVSAAIRSALEASPIVAASCESGKLTVVGGVYSFATGRIDVVAPAADCLAIAREVSAVHSAPPALAQPVPAAASGAAHADERHTVARPATGWSAANSIALFAAMCVIVIAALLFRLARNASTGELRLTVGARILGGSAVTLVLFLASALILTEKVEQIRAELTAIAEVDEPLVEMLSAIERSHFEATVAFERALLARSDRSEAGRLAFETAAGTFRSATSAADTELEAAIAFATESAEFALEDADRKELSEVRSSFEQLKAKSSDLGDRAAAVLGSTAGGTSRVSHADAAAIELAEDDITASIQRLSAHLTGFLDARLARTEEDESAAIVLIGTSTVISLLLGIAFALGTARNISRRLRSASTALESMASGDLTVAVADEGRDEVGAMAHALNSTTDRVGAAISTIAKNSQTLASSSEEMSSVGKELAQNAAQTSNQVSAASAAAEQVNRSVQSVATATDEMTATIKEIARNVSEATKVSHEAVTIAHSTNATVEQLVHSSNEIGDVIRVIESIAQQTNLLALNATIEAARAGEAGKGFAVVASEVKDLAGESAQAAGKVRERIAAIQGDATRTAGSLAEIGTIIDKINEFQTVVMAAIEEQTAASAEISRSLGEAARGSGQIANSLASVAAGADNTQHSAEEAGRAVSDLARMSTELDTLVGRFRCRDS